VHEGRARTGSQHAQHAAWGCRAPECSLSGEMACINSLIVALHPSDLNVDTGVSGEGARGLHGLLRRGRTA
jgi:hypothetical protein